MTTKRHAALLFAVPVLCLLTAALFVGLSAPDISAHAHVAQAFDPFAVVVASPLLVALRDKRADLGAQMQALVEASESEDRDLTAEEEEAFDKLKAEKESVEKRIGRLESLQASTAPVVIPAAARRGSIVHPPAAGARREFESVGEFMHAVRFNPNDQRLNYVENVGAEGDGEGLSAEMRMDDGPSGGFAIPPEFRNTLLRVQPQDAIVRPRAQVLEPGNAPDAKVTLTALDQRGAAPGNMFGGVEVQWIGEGEEKPDTDLKLREVSLEPHEVAGTITITDKLLRNWQGSSAFIEAQMRGAVRQSEDFAFIHGNGINKPLGILNSPALFKVPRGTANVITYDDVVEMVARGHGNGVFVFSRSALPSLMKLRDPAGNYIWVASAREGEPASLAGRPAIMSDRNPLLGALGDIWYGDLSMYLIKDGSGPFVAASEHVLFKQNKTMIKIFWNVDGKPWLTAPFPLENGYQVSPFVALDVPGA
ncbi:phage major capsid protein [Aureimonas mangrovi]|uniref:phage major capsid protein n=1 Tax=Aureimonas mangrovi TaxID=2758041 RepID=UPI00163DD5FB|nr:phage major capsid protein [Aureimonas mangrovi]